MLERTAAQLEVRRTVMKYEEKYHPGFLNTTQTHILPGLRHVTMENVFKRSRRTML